MLFITNRTPRESAKSEEKRSISFDTQNTTAAQSLFFCERKSKDEYIEIMSQTFFKKLKEIPNDAQLLFYIHGFNSNMEPDVFENTRVLQELFDEQKKDLVIVIPIIWPCDDDSAIAIFDDYWDDRAAADASGPAFKRLLGKFDSWREAREQKEVPCLRRINVLSHSMGNRVLKNALKDWAENHLGGQMPQIFRNVFMVAPDVENEILEKGEDGQYIVDSARNVVVYYANDDFAMPASKLANACTTLSRRLGMTGPEKLSRLPKSVYEVDCDDFNNSFDTPLGHTYFLRDRKNRPSPLIKHMVKAISKGRVKPSDRSITLPKPQ